MEPLSSLRSSLVLISAVVCTLAPSMDARALIIEGTFTGSVHTSNDKTNTYSLGYGNTLGGATITGTFRYDTDLAMILKWPRQFFRVHG